MAARKAIARNGVMTTRSGLPSGQTAEETALDSENEPTAPPQAAERENEAGESDEKTSDDHFSPVSLDSETDQQEDREAARPLTSH